MTSSLRAALAGLLFLALGACATPVAGTAQQSPRAARLVTPERIQIRLVIEEVTDSGVAAPTTRAQAGESTTPVPGTAVRPSAPDGSVVMADHKGRRFLLGPIKLDGAQIESATAAANPTEPGTWEVDITMTATGTAAFAELTRLNTGQRFAIVVAGVVVSAPRISAVIDGGKVRITGTFTKKDAADLAGSINGS